MVNGLGSRATACALLAAALVGCGDPNVDSLVSSHQGAGGAAGAASTVAANTAGTAGGSGAPVGGAAGATTAGGGTGGAGPVQAVTLTFSWSTYWLKGTTKTPLTCADLGAQAVGFAVSGKALDGEETVLAPMGQFCENGSYQNYPITLPAGEYSLGVSLSSGLAANQTLKALLSGLATFTVPAGATHVDIPEVKLVRIMLPLSWSIEKSGSSSTCANVGATQVDLVLNEVRDDYVNTISWSQPCSLSPSQPLAKPGTYQLTATLKSDSATLATWTAPEKLSFSTESAAIPPAITFKVP